jgi:tetratricopeptide (TPR) repeat protein
MQNERLVKLLEFLAQKPDDVFLKYALALEFTKINDIEKASVFFNDLLENCSDYLPTYYQAGKFFETINEQKAIEIYKKGIKLATEQKNNHTKGELQTALSIID